MLLDRLCWSVKYSSALNASGVKASSAPYHNVSRVLSETPSRSMGSVTQRVTGATDCLDDPRSATGLEFVAQVLDAHVDQVRIAQKVEAPDLLEDLFARQHLARMAQEQLEQLVLACCQLQQLAVTARLSLTGHQLHVQVAQHLDLARLHTTQQGAHAGQQFLGVERLDHVVVGATVEAVDLIDGFIPSREHQDGHGTLASNGAAHFEAVGAWQHDIQHDQVHLLAAERLEGGVAFGCRHHAVAVDLENAAHHAQDARIVVDDQDVGGGGRGQGHGVGQQ